MDPTGFLLGFSWISPLYFFFLRRTAMSWSGAVFQFHGLLPGDFMALPDWVVNRIAIDTFNGFLEPFLFVPKGFYAYFQWNISSKWKYKCRFFFFAMALRNQSRFEILSGSRSNGTRIRGEVVSFIWFFFLETETRTDSTGGQRSRKRRPLAAVRVRRPFRPTPRQLPRRRRRRRRTTTPPQPHAATLQLFRFL